MRYLLLTFLVGLLSLPAFCQGGKIVFASYRSGNGDIYLMNPDGSGLTNLTNAPEVEGFPSWRADAGRIAFQRANNLWTMAANGSGAAQLATGNDYTDPNYSPDGTTIVFSKGGPSDYDLYTVPVSGGSPTLLKSNQYGDYHPRWSPDGSKICFHTFTPGIIAQVFTVKPDGSGQIQLTFGAQSGNPAWSPDGNKIVYEVGSYDGTEIYVMSADGTGQVRLTNNSKLDGLPTFSPDGSKIAFISSRDGNEEIYVMNADGTGQTRLTNNAARDTAPSWAAETPANAPVLSIGDATINESQSGSATLDFTVSLSAPSTGSIAAFYNTSNGTAKAPGDYTAVSGASVFFTPGETSKTISITVQNDALDEDNETLSVDFYSVVNATIGDGSGIGTIVDDDTLPAPSVSISDVSLNEGNVDPTNFPITVTLSEITGKDVTVTYTTSDGTATQPGDYAATTGTVTIPAEALSATFNIPVVGDTVRDPDETLTITLSDPVNATLDDAEATVTIVNDDFPLISIAGVTLNEGATGQTDATFTVTLSETSPDTITFDFSTVAGTATAGVDYITTSGSGTFLPGETTLNITVPVLGDMLDESDEGFSVVLSNLSKVSPGTLSATGLITDDDAPPTISINDVTQTEGNSGIKNFSFTVTLSAVSGKNVSVAYATADGSATQPSDYSLRSGTLIIAAGNLSSSISVPVVGNLVKEPDETFTVTLSNPGNGVLDPAQSTATGTITNDDVVQLTVTGTTVTEGDSGQVNAAFTVTIPETSPDPITFNYATASNSAAAGTDYTTTSGSRTLQPGETSATINVPILGDVLDENNETFFLNLSNPVNATLANSSATATITDDDAAPTVSIAGVSQYEGNSGTTNFSFAVTLSAVSGKTVTVNYATANGTANQPSDYTARSGTATIAASSLSTTIVVSVVGDTVSESNENFTVSLSSPINATIGTGVATGTILTDDLPRLSVSSVTIVEGNSGSKNAVFVVQLSAASTDTVAFDFGTQPGSATAGADYVTTNGSRTLLPGAVQASISVPVKGDIVDEADETFSLQLSNPVNALLGVAQPTFNASEHFYERVNSTVYWDVAKADAESRFYQGHRGHLVTITSAAEQNYINATLGNGGWIGAYQRAGFYGADSFAWVTGEPFVYSNWHAGEPNNTGYGDVVGALYPDNTWNDDEREHNFTYIVEYDLVPLSLDPGKGIALISDDDASPQLSISDAQVIEGTGGARDAVFTLNLSAASGRDASVDFNTADDTATVGDDYQNVNRTVVIPAGQSSVTVAVPIVTDAVIEDNETFLAQLSNPTNLTIDNDQATGTLIDDDRTPSLSISDLSMTESNGGSAQAVFTLTLSSPSWKSITVSARTTSAGNPEATHGADYTAVPPTVVTFNPGQTSKTVKVTLLGDMMDENDEKFALTLSSAVNATIADGSGVCTILDNDSPPVITASAANTTEGNSGGTTPVTFTLKLSATSGKNVSVQVKTTNAATFPATAGVDYTALGLTTVIIPAGQTSKTVDVTIKGDDLDEDNERIALLLSNPVNATLGIVTDGTILDDDASPSLSINDVQVIEGNAGTSQMTFTVTLSAVSARTVTVNVATSGGGSPAATASSDYVALASTLLTFTPGQTSKQVSITINSDTTVEANEKFGVILSGAVNATIADNSGIGTILNDDAAPLTAPSGNSE